MNKKVKIAIFASGTGSNARKIIEYFTAHLNIEVALVVCNKPKAGVLEIAADHNIETLVIERELFFDSNMYIDILKKYEIDFIVLAGFLWKIPPAFIAAWPKHIINIHPALLPKYGGKGMYGQKVHEAVIANGESESGITIHYVDELYDHGDIILQEKCSVMGNESPESLANKIHELEHKHYAKLIEEVLNAKKQLKTS